jgi:hypothetical protein
MVCLKCRINYDESRKYCRNCGGLLSAQSETLPGDSGTGDLFPEKRKRTVRICPRCNVRFEVGNYCRSCGSSLKREDIFPGLELRREMELVRSLSSEWFRVTRRKKELDVCLVSLEKERKSLAEDLFNLTFHRYQLQGESLSARLREIEAGLESATASLARRKAPLEEEYGTLQKRLDEIRFLRRKGAMTPKDYSAEKSDLKRQMRSIAKCSKESREAITRVSVLLGGPVPLIGTGNLIRYPAWAIVGGVLIVIAAGVCFLWAKNETSPKDQGSPSYSLPKPSSQSRPSAPSPKAREEEKIRSLFETIRRANLEKSIDLFMSCYAADFKGKDEKRSAIIESWENFDYLALSYDLKSLTVTPPTAHVRVEWLSDLSPKPGGTPEKTKSVLDVSLKKEDGHWKIEKTDTVS